MTTSPAWRQRSTSAGLGAWAKLATRTPLSIISATRSPTSATSVRMFTPKGRSVRARTSPIAVTSSS
jgi:hypothetical protein